MITDEKSALAAQFVNELVSLHFDNVFNPYADICPIHDKEHAALIRCQNLQVVLEAAISKGVDSLWFARDLGYRGGRRTGLALTDELHLPCHARLAGIPALVRATKGIAMVEVTATAVWKVLDLIDRAIFLWNIFPLHPHEPDNPMTNGCHKRSEGKACEHLNLWLIEMLRPKHIIAIGRDAYLGLNKLGIDAVKIRHPSYGGQPEFVSKLARFYEVNLPNPQIQSHTR